MVIDIHTYNRFVEAEIAAKERGISLVEALEYRRLLMTVKLERDIAVGALEEALRRLQVQSPNRLMAYYHGRVDGTSAEMLEAVKMWLETFIRSRGEGKLEDL